MKYLCTTVFVLLSLHVMAAAPTLPATNPWFGAIDGGYVNLGWSSGNGARRIVICKAGSPVAFVPQNGIDYTDNTIFGNGQEVAPGEFVVYDHFSSSFYLTGLSPATQYYFRVYEYNGTGMGTEYLTNAFLSGSVTTSATPTTQTGGAVFTNVTTNSVNVNWVSGNGYRRLIVVRQGSPVNADPVSGQPYNVSYIFGNGATTGAGNYTVYNNTGTGTNVTNLQPGTAYFFAFYEFNGSSQPQYLTPAYTTSITTRSVPTVASSGATISQADGKQLSLNWTNGNGQRRIIVARKGNDVTSVPASGTDYNANPVFGTGQQLGAGEYVVFDDNFHSATVTGLDPASAYYFKIFEYDGTGSNTAYLTSSFASVNGSTVATPTVQTVMLPASDITSTSLRLRFTPGNGRARLIIGRKDMPASFSPADFTTYGDGDDLGNGHFVVSNTTGSYATVQGLQPGSAYHFAVFEYNGINQPLYLSPAAVYSAVTSGTLPVKLAKWEAVPSVNKVKLQWTTSAELNAGHFIIERSADGIDFSPLATVQATGNSQTDVTYSKEDNDPLSGKSFYRLKMVDPDGYTEYSPVRMVLLSEKTVARLTANPVRHTLEMITSASANGNKNAWQIINAAGQVVRTGKLSAGRTAVDVSGLLAGKYWVRIIAGNDMQTLSFIKQ